MTREKKLKIIFHQLIESHTMFLYLVLLPFCVRYITRCGDVGFIYFIDDSPFDYFALECFLYGILFQSLPAFL